MSAPDLKPCPFCGGPAELISPASGGNPYVMCIRNYCTQPHVECVTAWNTRTDLIPSDPRVRALVEAATVTLHDIDDLVANSEGVTGLHMNGDVACWESLMDGGAFGAWLSSVEKLRLTLAALKGA